MTAPGRGALGWFAATAALSWAVVGLLWAQVIVLPNPLLPPPSLAELLGEIPATPHPERFIVMLAKETSLLLLGFAALGLALAALARRAGAPRSALAAALLCVATVAVSLAPVVQARKAAAAEGVTLSLAEYFAGPASAAERRSETVTYARPGEAGEDLRLDVWHPPGGDPGADDAQGRPAVVVVHGGGWRSGERGEFPSWNAWLADRGYVVFDIDYRLSPPPSWQGAPADVRCAVAWVKDNAARYDVDPDRVALVGRSAGGHLALLAAYAEGAPSLSAGCDAGKEQDTGVAAVAAFYPPTDLAGLRLRGYVQGAGGFLGGTPVALPGRYRLSSPVSRVGPIDPPTFLVHGGDDRIVPPGQSALLAGRLQGSGVPHRLVELPWANHTFDFFWGGWGSQITRFALDEFLSSHLETPVEAKGDPPGSRGRRTE
jgi:acetyl esterase